MSEKDWRKSSRGLWLPPEDDSNMVCRVKFEVEVAGFKPPEKTDGK